ncbi:hypothetical protein [Stenotrophomonas sp. AB1(2024)]|uniref:hypothetical protein n=1 Tax=Stenotrophomonas sp. AB1(2024) TaxID=3132215 RepID=UPI0030B0EB81
MLPGGGTIDNGFDVSVGQAIAGPGGLTKNGVGMLALGGEGTYAGITTIAGGRLLVNGSIASAVEVEALGILGGNGQAGSTNNAGTVAPGNSIGTLAIAGDYRQLPNGTLEIELELDDQGRFDRLNVSGAASLAGHVNYVPSADSTFPSPLVYTYLTTDGGAQGTLATPDHDFAGVRFETVYGPNQAQLRIVPEQMADDPSLPDDPTDPAPACINVLDRPRGNALTATDRTLLAALIITPSGEFARAASEACPRDSASLLLAVRSTTGARMGLVSNRIAQVHRSVAGPSLSGLPDAYRLRSGVELWIQGSKAPIRTVT